MTASPIRSWGFLWLLGFFMLNVSIAVSRFNRWPLLHFDMYAVPRPEEKMYVYRSAFVDLTGKIRCFPNQNGTRWHRYFYERNVLDKNFAVMDERLVQDCKDSGMNCTSGRLVVVRRSFEKDETGAYRVVEKIVYSRDSRE